MWISKIMLFASIHLQPLFVHFSFVLLHFCTKLQSYMQEEVHLCGPHLVNEPYLKQLNLQQPIHQLISCLHLALSSISSPTTQFPLEVQFSKSRFMGGMVLIQRPNFSPSLQWNEYQRFAENTCKITIIDVVLLAICTRLHLLGTKVALRI